MKLNSVEVHPANSSDSVVLSFQDPYRSSKFNVKGIVGLDADEIGSRYYGTSGAADFYDLLIKKRVIVISVELNPDYSANETYSDLRDYLYRIISTSRTGKVQLEFKNNNEVVAVSSGFISKFESALFEKVPEVKITVDCDEPLLRAPDPVDIPVSTIDMNRFDIIDNQSTAPHGFSFQMHTTDILVGTITIKDPDDIWFFTITVGWAALSGDIIIFSSDYYNRRLELLRGATTVYLADSILPGSVWPTIFPGKNTFSFNHTDLLVMDSVSYYPTYWGV